MFYENILYTNLLYKAYDGYEIIYSHWLPLENGLMK